MFRRAIFMFCFMMFSLSALIFALYKISTKEKLYEVANNKNFYRLKIANSRGTIYDCRGIPLLGKRKKLLAAVTPNQENFIKILNLIQEDSREIFIKKFQNNLPFVIELKEKIECNGIQIFEIPVRYSDSTLAQHVIGYLSDEGVGLCGIEKSFEEHLGNKSDIEVIYQRNAAGKLMTGQNYSFNDKSYLNVSGVKLCIDERIQSIVEETANKHIKKGAIIVSEVPNCKIRASVSFPGYLPESIELFLNSEDSNLMNRAICQYNLGSIFKLVTAAVILENGYNENIFYSCKGVYEFPDRTKTSCFNKVPHGYINLERAISLSCNTLFANFSKNIDPEFFIKISKELGFGNSIKLAPNIVSCKGNLPTIEELSNEKKMAMFSFGQASLMVTPIQVSGLINTIACEGIYTPPSLVEGIINEDGSFDQYPGPLPKRVLKSSTCKKIKNYMFSSINHGTSKHGMPENTTAAAKTSTAQTGIVNDKGRVIQSWFAGFFPFENPKYSIVILAENLNSGGKVCGPIFKEISEKLNKLL